ncbi:hypothetical protein [Actinoplanes utahensis]|uniref:Tetratricopeptide repeat protein n=1 Tax=Actinoplanes utahensis TaxID=1869 RepID=A0A0A6UNH9_ACTUT|nr:hypothetical protein [Actinoplanes utahensis]KHD76981.1 hypothetical protein MB27_14480 [Actinoplanes utahensis]GIF27223.1 hypothetical protein Aut01nite_02090 [Actinoplanes utahensis]
MTQPPKTEPDEVMAAIGAAVEQGRAGDRAAARETLTALWDRTGGHGDALHRCSIAHYLADLQDETTDELLWDQRALAAVTGLDDERARRFHDSLQARAFLPSLHLNLADAYRRTGDPASARHHLAAATTDVDLLPDDDYGAMLRSGIDKVRNALATGSTHPLQ